MSKIVAYIRTSTSGQDLGLEVQRKAVEIFEPEQVFSEKISGRKEKRQGLSEALARLEKDDTLLIYKMSIDLTQLGTTSQF